MLVALLFASRSAVSAQPGAVGPIDCALDITYDEYPDGLYWDGTVTGSECSVEGRIRFCTIPEEYLDAGKTTHFVEDFIVEPTSGGEIRRKNYGVWNTSTFKFRSNGWVTSASDEWAYLVGFKYHESGTTSNLADGLPLTTSDGMMKMVPANRQNAQ